MSSHRSGDVEAAVIGQLRALLRAPEMVVRVWRCFARDGETEEREVVAGRQRLFPADQARIVQLLVGWIIARTED